MSSSHVSPKRLLITIILTACFMLIEYAAGVFFKSLSLISDASHMMTDVSALIISWVAVKLSQIPANSKKTFGYYRFEILAASFNTSLLLLVGIYIFIEAIKRIYEPAVINSSGMIIVAIIGFLINLLSVSILHSSKDDNLNFKSAYLEVMSDMISSLGVIIGAIIIHFTHLFWLDTVIAILISFWIVPRTWALLRESINILLESVPEHINYHEVKKSLLSLSGVKNIHDLHIWSLSTHKINLTAHVLIQKEANMQEVLGFLQENVKKQYSITHTTFQLEYENCGDNLVH
jgi:cobalt-zinc-cadmium efflux system protein